MHGLTRRSIIKGVLASSAGLAAGSWFLGRRETGSVLIVGGGPAGIAAALALRETADYPRVALIEKDPTRIKARGEIPSRFSRPNALAGFDRLVRAGVDIMLDEIVEIDWRAQRAMGFSGRNFAFDRIVLAPGTTAKDEGIVGYDAVARHNWPAAWGSAREAKRLAVQLAAMPEKGQVVMRIPEGAISHPHGIYQRTDEIAAFLARSKRDARLMVLDANSDSIARRIFERKRQASGWGRLVDWRGAEDGGCVLAVDPRRGVIETSHGMIKADVVNFITAQRAGEVAHIAGLADATGWCPCTPDQRSQLVSNALIVGDAVSFADRSFEAASKAGVRAAMTIAGA